MLNNITLQTNSKQSRLAAAAIILMYSIIQDYKKDLTSHSINTHNHYMYYVNYIL